MGWYTNFHICILTRVREWANTNTPVCQAYVCREKNYYVFQAARFSVHAHTHTHTHTHKHPCVVCPAHTLHTNTHTHTHTHTCGPIGSQAFATTFHPPLVS